MINAILKRRAISTNGFAFALALAGAAFAMVVVAYGMDSVAQGAHDVFHDFRHAIGFPCH
ncbi:MAG: hypothetical protein IEMM0002_0688 [bacterium]|nr:MAG: hypothetical protein IEMM0002_0688 [bacterium]